jgi:hypothetical protein
VVSVGRDRRFGKCAGSVLFEHQSKLGTGCYAVSGLVFVSGLDFVGLEDAVTGVVNGKQLGVDGIALGMADTPRLFETNFHVDPPS